MVEAVTFIENNTKRLPICGGEHIMGPVALDSRLEDREVNIYRDCFAKAYRQCWLPQIASVYPATDEEA